MRILHQKQNIQLRKKVLPRKERMKIKTPLMIRRTWTERNSIKRMLILTYKVMIILMMEMRMKKMTRKEKPQLSLKAKLPPKNLRRMEIL